MDINSKFFVLQQFSLIYESKLSFVMPTMIYRIQFHETWINEVKEK